jgi:xanthine dehydrogenase accessory factor
MEYLSSPDPEPYRILVKSGPGSAPAALATVVEARGSTPQVAGASALISAGGLLWGTVGGGVVEAKTIEACRTALRRGHSSLLRFNLENSYSSEADAVCGGRMRILVDAAPGEHRGVFRSLVRALEGRRRGVLATLVEKKPLKVSRRWFSDVPGEWAPGRKPWALLGEDIVRTLPAATPAWRKIPEGRLYLEPHFPPPRLLIAGAGHVGRAVARQGKLLGFEVTVIDDRPELASREAIPEAHRFVVGPVGLALKRCPLGEDAFVVIVTRGHRRDGEALRACIGRPAAYLGMIGSGRKVALMRDVFLKKKCATPAQWESLHAPIGLPLGSKTVAEIAVSIAAELIAVYRRPRTAGT